MASIKQETLTSVKWTTIERFSVEGIRFVLGIIMARLLTPSDYGILGMIAVFIAISRTFVDSGFGNALIRKLDRTDVDCSTVFHFNVLLGIVCYAILFLIAPLIAQFFEMPILSDVLRIQAITLVLNSLIIVHSAKLIIKLDYKTLAKRTLSANLIAGIVGVLCAYTGMGVWALVVQAVLSKLISVIFIWKSVKWRPQWVFSRTSFRELFSYGSKLMLAGLINKLFGSLNTFVIGKFFSSSDLGLYSRGTHFARMPVDNVNSIIGRVVFPVLVKYQDNDKKLVDAYRKYVRIMSMLIFFGCMLLASIAKPLILLLLTEKWSGAIIFLQIYVFACVFGHIDTINLRLLQIKGRSDVFLNIDVIKKTLGVVILFAAIPFGVVGICISKILSSQIVLFIDIYFTGKLFGLGYFEQMKDYMFFFIISLISCLPGYFFSEYVDVNYGIAIFLSLITGIALYIYLLRKNQSMLMVYSVIREKASLLPIKIVFKGHKDGRH